MKKQIAAATFLLLGFVAVLSMKEVVGASGHLTVAAGGCPTPALPSLAGK